MSKPIQVQIDADQAAILDALVDALAQRVAGVEIKPSRSAVLRIVIDRGCELIGKELARKIKR